jgi:hypothetical protein
MSSRAVTRINLLLEADKIRQLRQALAAPSNSAAVRRAIEERLAVEGGLRALRTLQKSGGLQDVFGRAPAKSQ